MNTIAYNMLIILVLTGFYACNQEGSEPETLAEIEEHLNEKREIMRELRLEIEKLEDKKAAFDIGNVETKPVMIDTIKKAPFSTVVRVQGMAESQQNVILNSKANGMVEIITVQEGERVSQGQILAKLDAEVLLSNIEEVKTSLRLAETNYQKLKNLREQNIGSEMQFLEAENQKESLEQKLATLNRQLDQTNLRAPFSGTVDDIFVKQGEVVMASYPMIRLVNLEKMEIEADVSESHVGIVETGNEVIVEFPSLKGLERTGTVSSVGQVINPNNRTFKVNISIENGNRMVKPNMLASIVITDIAIDSAIVIPTKLVQQDRQGKAFVYVLDLDDKGNYFTQKRYVTTGERESGQTRIMAGIEEGEQIITQGSREVSQGTFVSVKNL